MQVSALPEKSKNPTAPAYGPRRSGSRSAMISIARIFGAPDTVPAGNAARSASYALMPSRSRPSTWLTRCITCE